MRNLLEKYKVSEIAFVYLSYIFIAYFIFPFLSSGFFQVFNLENAGNPDIVFNDLFFKLQLKRNSDSTVLNKKKSVVFINSGSLSQDSFRLDLANLIEKLKATEVRSIGIDHDFETFQKPGTDELIKAIESNQKIVVSYKSQKKEQDSLFINFKANRGDTRFPDFYTIRNYFSHDSTFAHQLIKIAYPNFVNPKKIENEAFVINYVTFGSGFIDFSVKDDFFSNPDNRYFKLIEGKTILTDLTNFSYFKELIKDKIVIIGHFGTKFYNQDFDSQDKFSVPVDTCKITMRDKTMFGAVIHANAIENILHPEFRFFEFSENTLLLLNNLLILTIIIILVVREIPKIFKLFGLVVLTFPMMVLMLFLMDKQIYLPMTNTMLYLLIVEEYVEVGQWLYENFKKKVNMLVALVILTFLLIFNKRN
jgi:CHASE2 domain-containing sensor protein